MTLVNLAVEDPFFFQNLEQKHEIMNKIRELELKNGVKIAAEVYPFQKFYLHQFLENEVYIHQEY